MVKTLKYLLPLLLSVPLIGQITLSQEEMLGIANNIKEMDNQIKSDSLILIKKDEQIGLLKERDVANEKLVDLVEPKWYEHRYIWLVVGFIVGKI